MRLLEFFTGDQPPLIKGAIGDVCAMLDMSRDMFSAASGYVLDNEILDVDLDVMDLEVDRREQSARHAVLEHLNVDPKREMVLSLKLITVAQEVERIGDLARMMSHAGALARTQRMGAIAITLRKLRTRTLQMFDRTRDCFIAGDPVVARGIVADGNVIKEELAECLESLAVTADVTSNEAVVYTLAAHAISRISSHLTIVASSVTSPFHQIRSGAAMDQ